jgi:hypothetical protein
MGLQIAGWFRHKSRIETAGAPDIIQAAEPVGDEPWFRTRAFEAS